MTCTPVPSIRVIEIKGVVMGGVCGACGGEEKHVQSFGGETSRKDGGMIIKWI